MKHILLLLFINIFLFADIAKVTAIYGEAFINRADNKLEVKLGSIIKKKDIIETKNNSRIQIIFKDNTVVSLGKSTILDVNEYFYDQNKPKESQTSLNVFKGAFKVITGEIGKINKNRFKLRTKNASIGIRGTIVLANQELIICTSGEIVVESNGHKVIVSENQMTTTKPGTIPTPAKEATKENLNQLESNLATSKKNDNFKNKNKANETAKSDQAFTVVDNSSKFSKKKDDKNNFVTDDINNQTNTLKTIDNLSDTTKNEVATNFANTLENAEVLNIPTFALENGIVLGFNTSTFQKYSGNQLKLNRNDSEVKIDITSNASHTFQYKDFDNLALNSYSTFKKVYGDLSFYWHQNGDAFDVYSDNLGDTFIGVFNYPQHKELFVVGNAAPLESFDKSKILMYKAFADVEKIEKYENNNLINKINLSENYTSNRYVFYNPYLDSLTILNKDFSQKGAKDLVIGSKNSINYYYSENFMPSTRHYNELLDANGSVSILGKNFQTISLGTSGTINNYEYDSSSELLHKQSTFDRLEIAIKDNNISSSVNKSDNLELNGFLIGKTQKDLPYRNYSISDNFNLNINRATGSFSSNVFDFNILTEDGSDTEINVKLGINSSVSDSTAYYISDDLFGTLFNTLNTQFTRNSNNYKLIDKSGFLFAIPDGGILSNGIYSLYDNNDNPIMSDDESSWGYWSASFDKDADKKSEAFIDSYSTWVAGVQTDSSKVQELINQKKVYQFLGKTMGRVAFNGNHESIKMDDTNITSLRFEFGKGVDTMNGSYMKFESDSTQWDVKIGNSNVQATGFNVNVVEETSFFKEKGSSSEINVKGKLQGQFYGTSDIKSVGGTFNIHRLDSSNELRDHENAVGVFKAIKSN